MEEPRARSSALASLRRHNTLDDESSIIKPDPASTATNQSDDDFVHLDEFLGSGITVGRLLCNFSNTIPLLERPRRTKSSNIGRRRIHHCSKSSAPAIRGTDNRNDTLSR